MIDEKRVEKADDLDRRAVLAGKSEEEAEKLIVEFTPYLRGRVSRYSAKYDEYQRDALFSTAMSAFYEAVSKFDAEKGRFFPFADHVIRMRLIDNIREITRHEGKTVSLDDNKDEGESAGAAAINMISMRNYEAERRREQIADEIEQFNSEIALWGITMEALVKASPKHKELRKTYYEVINAVAQNPDIMQTINLKRYFPIKEISKITGLPQKKLERARTFILATLIIKTGDFEFLSAYIQ